VKKIQYEIIGMSFPVSLAYTFSNASPGTFSIAEKPGVYYTVRVIAVNSNGIVSLPSTFPTPRSANIVVTTYDVTPTGMKFSWDPDPSAASYTITVYYGTSFPFYTSNGSVAGTFSNVTSPFSFNYTPVPSDYYTATIAVVDSNGYEGPANIYNYTITTVGRGQIGHGGNYGNTFNFPTGIVLLPDGNTIICEPFTKALHIISPSGVASCFAGGYTNGDDLDGVGLYSGFRFPWAICYDPVSSNLFVYDTWIYSSSIRIVSYPGAVVTTLVGNGHGSGGLGQGCSGMTMGPPGNLIISGNNSEGVIRNITYPDGVVTILAGNLGATNYQDGTGTDAHFALPNGIAYDPVASNVYVADHSCIRVIYYPTATVTTLAGIGTGAAPTWYGYQDGTGSNALFNTIQGLARNPYTGDLFAVDQQNFRIRRITSDGVVTTIAGDGNSVSTDGTEFSAQFFNPAALSLYAVDYTHYTIVVSETDGQNINSALRKIQVVPKGFATVAPNTVVINSVTESGITATWTGDIGASSYTVHVYYDASSTVTVESTELLPAFTIPFSFIGNYTLPFISISNYYYAITVTAYDSSGGYSLPSALSSPVQAP